MNGDHYEPITAGFQDWEREKQNIAYFFRIRDKQAAFVPMRAQIDNFINVLFMINHLQKPKSNEVIAQLEQLEMKPINCMERLTFLIESPGHYHAFIQLSELFTELEKQYMKKIAAIKNKTRIIEK